MKSLGERAVVIGGSVAGLLAARALADAYERVTVVEREELPAGIGNRRAVPQGRHGHALIARGQRALEELLPGIVDEMIDDGAPTYSAYHDTRISVGGHDLCRAALGFTGVTASRPFIEGHVRRRVLAINGIELRDGCEVRSLSTTPNRRRVTGVVVRNGDGVEEALSADLTVAATGRSARIPSWLEALGYRRPEESSLQVDIGYSSRNYRLPDGGQVDAVVLLGARPGRPRGMALFAQEEGRWLLTLAGYGEQAPPGDEEGFGAFLESVAPPDLLAILRAGEPLGELVTHSFPANRRRHYERMRRFPAGLLVVGDAICSFNPLYGQGMTVAAAEAEALRDNLCKGARGLRRRHFRAAARVVDHAWQLAVGADLALPEVKGERPLSVRLSTAYSQRLQRAAESNGIVVAAFGRVTAMLERPGGLTRPAILRRTLGTARADAPPWPGRPPRTPLRRRTLRVDGISTPLREAGPSDSEEAVVFVHGVPGSGADFEPLVASVGQVGRAVAWDAPGFGKADKPADFEQSVDGHAAFLGRALDGLGVERAHLVLHDFGGPWGLGWAIENPERFASVTLICTGVPIDYRWHRTARLWRTPLAGELAMATLTRAGLGISLRRSGPRRLPGPLVDRMYEDLDAGTQEAILRLYRSVDDPAGEAPRLVEALRPLDRPALVIWGESDPYLPAALAERQLQAFPSSDVHVLPESGHWPFVDSSERVAELLLEHLERVIAPADEPSRQGARAAEVKASHAG